MKYSRANQSSNWKNRLGRLRCRLQLFVEHTEVLSLTNLGVMQLKPTDPNHSSQALKIGQAPSLLYRQSKEVQCQNAALDSLDLSSGVRGCMRLSTSRLCLRSAWL